VFDEHNCQVFVRLVVELIRDPKTKADLPQFFDIWFQRGGITRDVSFMTIGLGGTALAVCVVSIAMDPTLTTAATGVAVSTSMVVGTSTALLTNRYLKEKHIEKGQKEIK
jgi:hexokinase